MRLIHTADWHLGRIFHGVHLTHDQAHLLDQVVQLARDTRPDVLLISGDIYDRAVPPPDAVALLDDVLSRLVLDLGLPVILIGGNHDSPQRIGFASRLLGRQGLHAHGVPTRRPESLTLHDEHGPVHFHCLPYAEPATVRDLMDLPAVSDHDSAMAARLQALDLPAVSSCAFRSALQGGSPAPRAGRSVVLAHGIVLGGQISESERPLATGEAGNIAPSRFDGVTYVALGHLHRPQQVSDTIHYPGSLFKYSFAEAEQVKSVNLVQIDGQGSCSVERMPLRPRRDVRRIEGTIQQLLQDPVSNGRDDYLMVSLLDREPVLDAMGRLHAIYPNVLHVERPTMLPPLPQPLDPSHRLDEIELFRAFYSQVTGRELESQGAAAFSHIVDQLHRQQREADR